LLSSIPAKAQDMGALQLHLHWLRRYGLGAQKQVDDSPFGGGPGMVLKPEPFFECLDEIAANAGAAEAPARPYVLYPTPAGATFTQATARRLAERPHLVFLCGHYEGIDERVVEHWVDEEVSIGDYVLSSGELATMVVVDAVVRLLPGVIKEESYQQDSFYGGGLDHPHYTKPACYRGLTVPEVLLSGHHQRIQAWRQEQRDLRTRARRPDLASPERGIE
jgi:tRNA (guanine37-N1)-methyltransferase